MIAAVSAATTSRAVVLQRLDPTVDALAIPAIAELSLDEEVALSNSVDEALDIVKSRGRSLASITWSALREARPAFGPTYLDWARDLTDAFEGDVSLLFFVDMGEISSAMAEAIRHGGFRVRLSKKRPLLLVEDGRFRAHVGLNALIAEALWTASGPRAVIGRRARALAAEFRAFQTMLLALRRRFPNAQIDIEKAHFIARQEGRETRIDYRHLCAAQRSSGRTIDAWLADMRLADVDTDGGTPGIMLRSPAYRRARPNVLAKDDAGYSLVAVRVKEGRVRPVPSHVEPDDSRPDAMQQRFRYFEEETARQIGTVEFSARVILPELEVDIPTLILVGDQVASIAIDPALVRAAYEVFFDPPRRVRVRACAEDVLVIADADPPLDDVVEGAAEPRPLEQLGVLSKASLEADEAAHLGRVRLATEVAIEIGSTFERELQEDPSDRLDFDALVELPSLGAGRFELQEVAPEVLELLDKARSPAFSSAQQQHLRGVALTLLGQYDRAVAALSIAVRGQREDADVNLALGRAHLLNDAPADAVTFLARAHALAPGEPEVANTLGLAQFGAGLIDDAVASFTAACAIEPIEAAFYVNLGRAEIEREAFEPAEAALRQAIDLAPLSAEANATMALLHHRRGDNDAARRYASRAMELDPEDGSTRTLLLQIADAKTAKR